MNILIADDHTIMREGLSELLRNISGVTIVGEANNGGKVIELCKQLSVDLVIMDISMPKCNGIDATKIIKEQCSHIKVIILSVHSEKNIIKEALAAGADGYICKSGAFKEMNDAIAAVTNGQVYISPKITTMLVNDFISPQAVLKSTEEVVLAARERIVLQWIAEGKRSREIAQELNTGIRTVERTRSVIMEKLGLHTVADLTKYAIRNGLTTLDS